MNNERNAHIQWVKITTHLLEIVESISVKIDSQLQAAEQAFALYSAHYSENRAR